MFPVSASPFCQAAAPSSVAISAFAAAISWLVSSDSAALSPSAGSWAQASVSTSSRLISRLNMAENPP